MKRAKIVLITIVLLFAETIVIMFGTVTTMKAMGGEFNRIKKEMELKESRDRWNECVAKCRKTYAIEGIDIDCVQADNSNSIEYQEKKYIYLERNEEGDWRVTSNYIPEGGFNQEMEKYYYNDSPSDEDFCEYFFKNALRYAIGQISGDYYFSRYGKVPESASVSTADDNYFTVTIYGNENGSNVMRDYYEINLKLKSANDKDGRPIDWFSYY